MDKNNILNWYKKQLKNKKAIIEGISDLSDGSIFLQLLHSYHPKFIDLSKVYYKPKNNFKILQNFKQLLWVFGKLGWKKFDPDRYAKQRQKEYLAMANYIMKNLTEWRSNSKNDLMIENDEKKNYPQFHWNKLQNKQQSVVLKLQQKKKNLLSKIMAIQHIVKEASDAEAAKSLIRKMIDH